MKYPSLILVALLLVAGCDAKYHSDQVGAGGGGQSLTVGKVQSEIAKGMTGGQVAEVLGSPNIVSTDENGREVWIYDRFATEVVASQSTTGVWFVIGATGTNSGAATTSQRSLTVVIKFDDAKKVRDVAYHSSKF